jgi:transcriptional regulator with XRE-family HTH domain
MMVNERIKKIRNALHKSQREFAREIYVSNGYLSEIETGHKEVNGRLIHLISSTFAVNKHWLVTGEGQMFNTSQEDKMERMIGLFTELYPEFQDFILRQIDELIELQNVRRDPASATTPLNNYQ